MEGTRSSPSSITCSGMTQFHGRLTPKFPCANRSPVRIERGSYNATAMHTERDEAQRSKLEKMVCCHLNLEIQIFNRADIRNTHQTISCAEEFSPRPDRETVF
ncbi:unnamed protein product [Pleuronectes platessa]|uniref:Uncharacterized protein n=1 Tax=Pleuronectes platessa TaxID=8262 RepID=A0A9N7W2E6_PLEPL|nr:unnamed protein product [Pleuronectes platessa]